MSNDVDGTCGTCGCDMSFFQHQEYGQINAVCPLCYLIAMAEDEDGGDTIEEIPDVSALDRRVVGRIISVCDMISAFDESVDLCQELIIAGRVPETGLDVELSEHHLSSAVIDRVETVSHETISVMRALARTLIPCVSHHPDDAEFVLRFHPSGDLVTELLEDVV